MQDAYAVAIVQALDKITQELSKIRIALDEIVKRQIRQDDPINRPRT